MIDAPERIWTGGANNGAVGECWYDATDDGSLLCGVEYVRADIAAAEIARLKGHLEQAAHRLDWCAMVMPTKNYRNTVRGWRDEADAASETLP